MVSTSEAGYAEPVNSFWSTPENLERTPELIWPANIEVYDQMRRTDAQVGSVLRAVTLPIRRTRWSIDPNGARDEVVDLVSQDLGLPVTGADPAPLPRSRDRFSWVEHLRLALLMLTFGHSPFEQIYRIDPAGRARLRKLGWRPPRTISKVDVAADGGLVALEQYSTAAGVNARMGVDRLVVYVNEREGGNWLGQSLLRPAYKFWLLKDRMLRVQAQSVDRNGMGLPVYIAAPVPPELADADQVKRSNDDIAAGLAIAKSVRSGENAGAALPNGADLKLLGVEGKLPDADPVIRYYDEQIARAVLAHFLNLGTQTGSWALGSTFADFFVLSLQTTAMQIADTATQHVVEDLVDVNWGLDEPAPRIVFEEIGSQSPATSEAITALVQCGALVADAALDRYLRQKYALPEREGELSPGPGQQQTVKQTEDAA